MSEETGQDERLDNMPDEADNTYYIDGDLTTMGHLTACNKCGRKMLVEMALFGVPHHAGLSVTCGDCLVVSKEFRREQPEIASKIERWLHGGQTNARDQS